jgi:hypothetical protein
MEDLSRARSKEMAGSARKRHGRAHFVKAAARAREAAKASPAYRKSEK